MTSSLPEPDLPPARIRLLRETAAGPISAVFVGQVEGGGRVAVKLLREAPDGGVEHLLDLRDRARRLGSLAHRHHAVVVDIARVDQRFALVSPYVDGIDLLDWVDVLSETGRLLPRRVTCEILRCVAVALEAASSGLPGQAGAGPDLRHRDLKPSNILITRDGELKVTDFATGYTSLAGRAARSGALKKGLVRYLSPERRDGRRVQAEADVYALGIMALELFRGRWLRRLHSQNPAHDRHIADVVARLEDLQMRSDSDDRALRNLLLRMVAFDPEARPAVSEIASACRGFADRASGPSLEAFANAHAVPWLDDLTAEPDEALGGVMALVVDRGRPLPEPSGPGIAVVTLPDRYDLQLQAAGNETGEFGMDDLRREVTDPRLRALGVVDEGGPLDDDLDAPEETEEVAPVGPPAEAELWGPPASTAEVLHDALSSSDSPTPHAPPVRERKPLERPETVLPAPPVSVTVEEEVPVPVLVELAGPATPVPAASVAPPPPAEPVEPVEPVEEEVILDDLDLLRSSQDDLGHELVLDEDIDTEDTTGGGGAPIMAAVADPPPPSAPAVESRRAFPWLIVALVGLVLTGLIVAVVGTGIALMVLGG